MPPPDLASRFIEQEARSMITRLDRIRPFALYETMVPAAALAPVAQSRIDGYLVGGRRALRRRIVRFIDRLRQGRQGATPAEQQRRYSLLRLQFNTVLSQFDLFAEVITQRSERENGVWLSGLDVVAADAMHLPVDGVGVAPAVCYLARGPGAAIRRAKTRLPGGGTSPVAIIRLPRERMVSGSVAPSLVHECGHAVAAVLGLVPSLRPVLRQRAAEAAPGEAAAWAAWERWLSEVVADLWSVGQLGIGATTGLMGVVSLPRWAVFRPSGPDPHPIPWVRVLLSAAMGRALYPHPRQWHEVERMWRRMYPIELATDAHRANLERLLATIPEFVDLLVNHRPMSLRGRPLGALFPVAARSPERLLGLVRTWRGRTLADIGALAPTLAFAALGQGRFNGLVTPEGEGRLVSDLLTFWALTSTLDISAICADPLHLADQRAG